MTRYIAPAGRGDCPTGKVQYSTRGQAKGSARRRNDNTLSAYRCAQCDWFHLGHKPQRVRNGEVDKAAWIDAIGPKSRRRRPAVTDPASFTPTDMARLVGRREEPA